MRLDAERPWGGRGWIAWLVPLAAAIIAVIIPSVAERPAPLVRAEVDGVAYGLPAFQRRAFFKDIASHEARWRGIARKSFPSNMWAQADHWTDHMAQHARKLARDFGVSVVQVLLAYDEGLHAGWRAPGSKELRRSWPPLATRPR